MTEAKTRLTQLYLVMAVGFLIPIVRSLCVFFGLWHPGPATRSSLVFKITFQMIGLLCLYLVLAHQGRRFQDIGLSFAVHLTEIGHSFALFFGAIVGSALLYGAVVLIYVLAGREWHKPYDSAMLFGTALGILPVLWVLLNPFHEELLVRAFLISETEAIYRSTTLAISASVALQTSYHLYQGLPIAL